MSSISVSTLSDVMCRLGEGPTYDPRSGNLFWFDISDKKLLEKAMPDGKVSIHDLPEMASALAVIDEDRQLLVTETGVYIRDVRTGALVLRRPLEADNRVTRSNDARVHPCGAFWIGTMGKNAEKNAGSIYCYFKGEMRTLFSGITIPNSICFSPDGTIAYFTDTDLNLLMRVDCDPSTGLPQGEPKVFFDQRGGNGGLDGSIVDADGVLWNTRWGAGSLDAYSPDGNRLLTIGMPALQCSCPAFIGRKADRIAVTSAWQNMTPEVRKSDPNAGMTFLVDRQVNGRFEPLVAL